MKKYIFVFASPIEIVAKNAKEAAEQFYGKLMGMNEGDFFDKKFWKLDDVEDIEEKAQ